MLSNDCKKDILKFSAVRCKISPAKKADRKPKHYEHTYKLRTKMYSLAFFERERTVCQAAPQFCKKKSRQVLMACRDDGCGRRIWTLTNRVRVCRATITQFRIMKLSTIHSLWKPLERIALTIIWHRFKKSKSFFKKKWNFFCRPNFWRFRMVQFIYFHCARPANLCAITAKRSSRLAATDI